MIVAVNVIKRSWKVDRLVRPETLNGMTFQAESGGHRFEITGYDANGSMIAFGGTVTAVFLRPDNTDVALTGVLSNGVAQVTLTEECYQVPGRFGLAVFVNQNATKTVVYDCIGTVARTSSGVAATSVVEDVSTLIDRIEAAVNSIPQDYSALSKAVGNITCPELRNGSTGNPWNTDSVTTKYIIKLDKTCDDLILEYIGNTSAAQYIFGYSIFKGVADGTESYEARSTAQSYADFPEQYVQTEPYVIIPMSQFGDYTHIAIVLWARSDDTTYIPLRIATEQYNLRVTFRHASYMGHEDINNRSVKVGVLNAAKMSSPLKLVHFSDLHKDINALNRIKASIEYVCPNADNIICTGDMVANTYAEITSWWDPAIMTVIGNHDTASWDGSSYDWTALSMAQRDEMYISPFKSYWGITHTSGTSYYYKDYPTAHIRLIVMDAMLYSGTPGAEATAQTSWLAGLLSDAIPNNLHVLIAIHAPHGGSVPVECSFTKLGQGTMPVNVDCNTPDAVINTVATAINAGLHFIGYICGHTHQDAIWDATGDGTQLMYCITCAAVDQTAQWINSDQYRTDEQDAFNVLTIDTASTTIKILRGGGANTDVALRPRVSLVIDYSTGKIITDTYASGTQDTVVYGEAQTLTDAEKAQARTNIGAGSAADVSENTADITANANEITSLKSALNDITDQEIGINIFPGYTEHGYLNTSTGEEVGDESSPYVRSGFIPLDTTKAELYILRESQPYGVRLFYYRSDKTFIENHLVFNGSATKLSGNDSIPSNAAYVRTVRDYSVTGWTMLSYTQESTYVPYDVYYEIKNGSITEEKLDSSLMTKVNNANDIGKIKTDLLTEKTVNFFDGTFPNSGYIGIDGSDASGSAYERTDYIPIDSTNETLYFLRTAQPYVLTYYFYNSSKEGVGSRSQAFGGTGTAVKYSTSIPSGAAFIRMYTKTSDYTGNLMISYSEQDAFIAYGERYYLKNKSVTEDNLDDALKEKINQGKKLAGKTIAFMGDSIIGNFYDATGVCAHLADLTGATVINCAFGGSRIGYRYSTAGDTTPGASGYIDGATDAQKNQVDQYRYWNALSGYGLSQAIASDTWTYQDSAVANITGGLAYFSDRLAAIKEIDWSEIDFIMWEYGTNDFMTKVSLTGDNPFAYDYAYRSAIEAIQTEYPNIRIITVTPIYRWYESGGVYTDDSNTHTENDYQGASNKLTDFVAKAQDISMENQLPCIDDYYTLGANKYTRLQFFDSTDGTHPNANGRKLIAEHLAAQLISLV